MLEAQLPELAHWFGLGRASVYDTPWRDLATYRARLPYLPPVGGVYLADPDRRG